MLSERTDQRIILKRQDQILADQLQTTSLFRGNLAFASQKPSMLGAPKQGAYQTRQMHEARMTGMSQYEPHSSHSMAGQQILPQIGSQISSHIGSHVGGLAGPRKMPILQVVRG